MDLRRMVSIPCYLLGTAIMSPSTPWLAWLGAPVLAAKLLRDPLCAAASLGALGVTVWSVAKPSLEWLYVLLPVYLFWAIILLMGLMQILLGRA